MTREDAIENIRSRYAVILPDGMGLDIDPGSPPEVYQLLKRLDDDMLSKYIESELFRKETPEKSASAEVMRRLELVDYEPAADSGHFRFYPGGSIVLDLLTEWANSIAVEDLGAMKIETPLIYDWSRKEIREQGETFHERHYRVLAGYDEDKEWVLRFAGDFGLFSMLKSAHISYRNLPMRIYELSRSFRYEKSGELSGLKRLRSFTMPDIHSFTKDVEEGWTEYLDLYREYEKVARNSGLRYVQVFRVVQDFFDQYREKLTDLVVKSGKPAFFEILSGMKHYWVVKSEFQGIDPAGGSCQLSTVQLDVVDSQRYGITYTDSRGDQKGCVICHSSVGSLERWLYMYLESAIAGQNPSLPLWLSPVQVRFIPVSESYNGHALEVCLGLKKEGFRCDLDDRKGTLAKKVRDSQKKWIPYVCVIGEDEVKSGSLNVIRRSDRTKSTFSPEEFAEMLRREVAGMPSVHSGLPILLSRRPLFFG